MSTSATAIPTGIWTVDPSHSKVAFAVKHMGIATVRGEFTDFEGTLEVGSSRAPRPRWTGSACSPSAR